MTKSTPLHFYYWYRWLSLLIFLTGSGLFTLTIYAALPIPLTVEITQVDIQNFPSVLFYATITGDQDTHVTDVTADHITVYEKYDASDDSAYAAQTGVSILESIGANNGINIALIFDASGSMQGSEAEVKSAANSLLGEFGINDRAGIIFFANTIDVEQLFIGSTIDSDTSDDTSTDLYKAVDNYQYVPSGRTRLYRGIEEGIIQLNQESGIKAVVVIADGADDGADIPDISKTELITFAQNSNIPVYSIGVGDTLDPEDLQDIATQTGGQYYAGSQAGGIEQIYDDIYSRLGSQYEIVYTTSNSAADGSTRSIKMEVDNSDGVLPFGERTYIVGIPPTIVRNQDTIAFSTGTHSTSEIIIKAQIEDPDDTTTDANIAAALFFRGVDSNSSYAQRAMTYNIAGSDFNFEATLTAIEVQQFGTENGGVEYYLRASDGQYVSTSPKQNPTTQPYPIAISPNYAPVINYPYNSGSPPSVALGNNYTVDVQEISDSTDLVSSATLYYRTVGFFHFSAINMTLVDGVSISTQALAIIPSSSITIAGIEFYISAFDNFGVRTDSTTATDPHLLNINPVISHTPPQSAVSGSNLTIATTITDITSSVASVSVIHREDSGDVYEEVAMTDNGNNTYSTTLDGTSDIGSNGIEYYIKAIDNFGAETMDGSADVPHSIPPNSAPVIDYTPSSPDYATVGQAKVITVSAIDNTNSIDRVRLYYKVIGSSYASILMTQSGNIYTASIPGNMITNTGINYYIEAWDNYEASTQTAVFIPTINHRPNAFSLISPTHDQTGLSGKLYLQWNGTTDSDGDDILYNVTICENSSFTNCSPNQVASSLLFWDSDIPRQRFYQASVTFFIVIMILASFIFTGKRPKFRTPELRDFNLIPIRSST